MSSAGVMRDLPHNADMERCVLGCALAGEKALANVLSILKDESYFYEPKHRDIYRAVLHLNFQQKPIDTITLGNELAEHGNLEKLGGLAFLSALKDEPPSYANALYYAKEVYEKAILRKLITAGDEIKGLAWEAGMDSEQALGLASRKIYEIKEGGQLGSLEPLNIIMQRAINDMERQSQDDTSYRRIMTGYPRLDHLLGGLGNGTLNILAARPGMGKSALALNIAQNAALLYKKSIAIFSLEMSKEEIAKRFFSTKANVNSQLFKNVKKMSVDDWNKISAAAKAFHQASIYIDDLSGSSPMEILTRCRQMKMEGRLDLIIIDYLQLMSLKGKNDSRQQEISEISRTLKLMAKELDVPVLALSQLSREVEKRDDKRPLLADLRESGSIEQDADTVMFIYRKQYYQQDSPAQDEENSELILAKNRGGPTKSVRLKWLPQFTLFIEPLHVDEPDHVERPGGDAAAMNDEVILRASDNIDYLMPPPAAAAWENADESSTNDALPWSE